MKSKKGAIFHWVLLGILVAIGLVFIITAKPELTEPKGMWELTVKNAFLAAEENQLNIETAAKFSAWNTALDLAKKGGFTEKSSCGELNYFNLWNKKEQNCLPKVEENFIPLFKNYFSRHFNINYNQLEIENKKLIAKTEEKGKITSSSLYILTESRTAGFQQHTAFLTHPFYLDYTYNQDLKLELGYSLVEDYNLVEQEAATLLQDCNSRRNVDICIEEQKKENWNLYSCSGLDSSFALAMYKAYAECLNTEETDCVCGELNLVDYSYSDNYIINFKLDPDKLNININDGIFDERLFLGEIFHPEPSQFIADNQELIFKNQLSGEEYNHEDLENIYFYRTKLSNGKLRLDLVTKNDNKYLLFDNEERTRIIKQCKIKPSRIRPFCVISPSKTILYDENKQPQTLKYKFALDFTPQFPLAPENLEINLENNQILISFSPEEGVNNYRIYYTNWLEVRGNQFAEETFSALPQAEGFGYFYQMKGIKTPETEDCPPEKEINRAYFCQNKIIFKLEDSKLVPGIDYKFSVTSVKEDKESLLSSFREFTIS